MDSNSYTARITGLSELAEPLEIGKNYTIVINADCRSIKKEDNDDGTFTFGHTLRQIAATITDDNGKVIKVKDKKSQSQKLRAQIILQAQEEGKDPDAEYERIMVKLRHFYPEIKAYLEKLD